MNGLSVVIATSDAPPSAFVVWRGLAASVRKAAFYGFDGVEVAAARAEDLRDPGLREALRGTGLALSCVSTGQLSAVRGLSLSHPDPGERKKAVEAVEEILEETSGFSDFVNLGRVRGGSTAGSTLRDVEERFLDSACRLCNRAEAVGVRLLLEPVNRYEIDFINSLAEGSGLLARLGRTSMALMADVFHMNIEDPTIEGELERFGGLICYVHLADSNRRAPGMGHLDFPAVKKALDRMGFTGWTALEILPQPDPDTAARIGLSNLKAWGFGIVKQH